MSCPVRTHTQAALISNTFSHFFFSLLLHPLPVEKHPLPVAGMASSNFERKVKALVEVLHFFLDQ